MKQKELEILAPVMFDFTENMTKMMALLLYFSRSTNGNLLPVQLNFNDMINLLDGHTDDTIDTLFALNEKNIIRYHQSKDEFGSTLTIIELNPKIYSTAIKNNDMSWGRLTIPTSFQRMFENIQDKTIRHISYSKRGLNTMSELRSYRRRNQ